MKRIALSAIAILASSGVALAGGQASTTIDFSSFSLEQIDALASVLAGLPRQ